MRGERKADPSVSIQQLCFSEYVFLLILMHTCLWRLVKHNTLYFQEKISHIVASVVFTAQSSISQKLTHNHNNNKGTNNSPICADPSNRVNKR